MIVDTSAASALVELVCLSLYGYFDSLMKTLGVRTVRDAVTESARGYANPGDKIHHIEACLGTRNSVDLWELRELALSKGGLLQRMCNEHFVFGSVRGSDLTFGFCKIHSSFQFI